MSVPPLKTARLLALGALVVVALAPPEAWGSGRMLLMLASTFALLILVMEARVPASFLIGGGAFWGGLLVHSVIVSADPYRSLDFLTIVWAYYCLFGYFRYSPDKNLKPVALTLVLLAGTVSLYAIYQFVWGLENAYNFVLYSETNEIVRVPILDRLATARVFAWFALPGTLWGFLLIALPLHAALWKSGPRLADAALVGNAGLVLAAGLMTRSFGFVAGLGALVLGWLLMRPNAARWRSAVLVPLAMILLAGAVNLGRAETHNPVTLRLQNWLTGWEIFAANPIFGSGLNTYAVLYRQHQQIGANETQFAHNTPVQLLAELGLLGVVAGFALALFLWPRRQGILDSQGDRRWVLLAILVWITHNLIDIDVYFASVGAVGVVLMGLLATEGPRIGPRPGTGRGRSIGAGAFGLLTGVVVLVSGVVYVSGELHYRAEGELANLKVEEAYRTLQFAAAVNPFDSSILHAAGRTALELHQKTSDPAYLAEATEHFERAIWLSPAKADPLLGLGLCLSSADRLDEALAAFSLAQTLHPYSRTVSAVRRQIERRQRSSPAP